MIWDVFASRGLGVNASAGDGNIGMIKWKILARCWS
jgi:hypothetical protein